MKGIFLYSVIVIAFGASATLALNPGNSQTSASNNAALATEAAFRDGMYLGRLSAETGLASNPPVGRWATPHDRTLFRTGYERAYAENRR